MLLSSPYQILPVDWPNKERLSSSQLHKNPFCPLNLERSSVHTAVQVYHWHKTLFPVTKNELKEIQSALLCYSPSVLPVSHHCDLIYKTDPHKSILDLLFSIFSERIQYDIDC